MKRLESISRYFKIVGFALLLFGLIHFYGILSQGNSLVRMSDTVFNSLLGVIMLFTARSVPRRSTAAYWLVASTIFLSIGYGLFMDRGFNFVYLLFGSLMLWVINSAYKGSTLS